MQHLTRLALNLAEQGLLPDVAIRWGIRQLLKQRLREIRSGDAANSSTAGNAIYRGDAPFAHRRAAGEGQ